MIYHTTLRELALSFSLLLTLCGMSAPSHASTPAQERQEIQKMRGETLADLYRAYPAARAHIQKAAGYAVFSNVGINLILLSAAGGSGVAVDKGGNATYMKMISGGVGFGLGVKDFRGVFVFATDDKLKQFINSGWEASAQADVAAKAADKGGALSPAFTVAPGVKLYQLTKNGLAVQATIQGTKYYKNDELNGK